MTMRRTYTLNLAKCVFLILFCTSLTSVYAGPKESEKSFESHVETLKKENVQLRHDIARLEKSQYQNIRQYHEDLSSDMNTYMNWVGIMAAILAMVVTAVSIAIPLIINNRFERRIEDWFNGLQKIQAQQYEESKQQLEIWEDNLKSEQKEKFDKIIKDVSNLKKDAKQSERKAWISQILSEANRFLSEKDYDKAITLTKQVLSQDDSIVAAHNLLGIAYGEKKDLPNAIESFSKALLLDPKNPGYPYNRARARYIQKDYSNALGDCDTAIKLDSENHTYYLLRGSIKRRLDDKKGALEDFTKAIELKPNESLIYYNRALVKHDLGDKLGAIHDYIESARIKPDVNVYNNLACLYLENKDKTSALSYIEKAISLSKGTDGNVIDTRGEIYMYTGELDKAIADFNRAIELCPDSSYIYKHRALCYRKMSEIEENENAKLELISNAEADESMAQKLSNEPNEC